jgi:hypothetical protein
MHLFAPPPPDVTCPTQLILLDIITIIIFDNDQKNHGAPHVISGFYRGVHEIFALLGSYAV